MNDIRAASVQFQHVPGDKAVNLATVRAWTAQAAAAGAELVIFPEMCLTGYWHLRDLPREALDSLAELVPEGESTQALLALACDGFAAVGQSCTRPCPRPLGANRISGPYVFPPPTPRQATKIRT